MARGLRQAYITGNHRGKDIAGEVPPHFLGDLHGEIRAPIKHRQQDAEYLQRRIQAALHPAHRRHQVGQAFQGVVFALDRDENAVRGAETVQCQQFQGGRAVDKKKIIARSQWLQGLL